MPIIRRKKTGGRQANLVLKAYKERYNLSRKQVSLANKILVQLTLCQSEDARRLLLGVRNG